MVAILMTVVPHFDLPFRFTAGHAAVVEQDSSDDISNCVDAVLLTRIGSRVEMPEFGIPDPTFDIQPIELQGMFAALVEQEPRAYVLIDQEPDRFDQLIAHLTVSVAPQTQQEGGA